MITKKIATLAMALGVMMGSAGMLLVPSAQAYDRYYNHGYSNRYSGYDRYDRYRTGLNAHPFVKTGLIGGGIGAATGALLGQDGDRADGAVKGALLGAGAGVGYQYLRNRGTFSRW